MRKLFLPLFIFAFLGACSAPGPWPPVSPPVSPAQITTVQTDQAAVQAKIDAVCGDASAAASLATPFAAIPAVGDILTFESASCGSAEAVSAMVSKALADPTTVEWVEGLATELKTAMAAVKSL